MSTAKRDFTINRGVTFQKKIVYRNSKRIPINLSGYTARLEIKTHATASQIYDISSETLKTSGTGIDLSPASGSLLITLSAADSSKFDFVNADYTLEISSGSKDNIWVTRLLEGTITLR